jgi:hypothetical protein
MFTRVTRTYSYMISLGAALAFSAPIVFAEEAHHSHAATQPAKAEFKGDPYARDAASYSSPIAEPGSRKAFYCR